MTKTPAQIGLIINKSVGGSVVRHRVARQLRHTLKELLGLIPEGARVVVRALPNSAGQDLRKDLHFLIPTIVEKAMAAR